MDIEYTYLSANDLVHAGVNKSVCLFLTDPARRIDPSAWIEVFIVEVIWLMQMPGEPPFSFSWPYPNTNELVSVRVIERGISYNTFLIPVCECTSRFRSFHDSAIYTFAL